VVFRRLEGVFRGVETGEAVKSMTSVARLRFLGVGFVTGGFPELDAMFIES